ncbi:hypothetical protein ACROYT_G015985 [Oculina patagonica]
MERENDTEATTGKTQRKRVSIGDKEKQFVLNCYNHCNGKNWAEVVAFAKQTIPDAAGMPAHVVNLYFSQSEDSIVNRMKNIIRNAVRQTQPPVKQQSKDLDVVEVLVSKHTKYAKPMTPAERKSEAVKAKMSNQFVDSSPNSSETEEEGNKRKKRKLDCAKEAQNAHTKMCEKALQTMDNVNNLLQKVEKYLDTKKTD